MSTLREIVKEELTLNTIKNYIPFLEKYRKRAEEDNSKDKDTFAILGKDLEALSEKIKLDAIRAEQQQKEADQQQKAAEQNSNEVEAQQQ